MKGRLLIGAAFVVALWASAPQSVFGEEEGKFSLRQNDTVKTLLEDRIGKPATLMLASGQEISGIVSAVGDGMVHLSKLTGRDFYDAALRLESVTGIVVRVRGR